jgi:hypothetical protein
MWLAYVRGEPDKAKTASDRIFGEYFPLIFDPTEMDALRVISVWGVYSAIEEQRRKEIEQARQESRVDAAPTFESSWMVEGLYHFAFALRKLAERQNFDIYDVEKIKPLMREAEHRLSAFVGARPRVSYYKLFRSSATKQTLFDVIFDAKALDSRQFSFDFGA